MLPQAATVFSLLVRQVFLSKSLKAASGDFLAPLTTSAIGSVTSNRLANVAKLFSMAILENVATSYFENPLALYIELTISGQASPKFLESNKVFFTSDASTLAGSPLANLD